MPVFDFDSVTLEFLDPVADWDGGGVPVTIPIIDRVFLHAGETSGLYHAEGTTGESTPVDVIYNVVDEAGNQMVDELGNHIVAPSSDSAILFHAKETDTLFHAEA